MVETMTSSSRLQMLVAQCLRLVRWKMQVGLGTRMIRRAIFNEAMNESKCRDEMASIG